MGLISDFERENIVETKNEQRRVKRLGDIWV